MVIADAALIVFGEECDIAAIATCDQRNFGIHRPENRRSFVIFSQAVESEGQAPAGLKHAIRYPPGSPLTCIGWHRKVSSFIRKGGAMISVQKSTRLPEEAVHHG